LDGRTLTQELSIGDDSVGSAPDDTAEIEDLSLSPITDQQLVREETEDNDKLSTTDETEIIEGTESEHSLDLDKTFSLTDLHVEEVFTDQANDQAEDTIEAEQAYDSETLSDVGDEYFSATVSAAQLAKDIGGDSPTPVAAQTVFAASSSQLGNQALQWGIFVVLCLVIAVSLSLFVFNYTIPVERSIKSPLVARDIEIQSEPVLTIEIPEGLMSSADVDSSLFTGEITDVIEKENDTAIVEGRAEGVPESERSQKMTTEVTDDQFALAQEEMGQEKIWTPSEDDSTGDAIALVIETGVATLPEKIILEPRLIKISRSKSVDKYGVLINEAFQEYLVGDYDSAEVSYHSVLKELPENRDALLGLAAISSRKGQLRQAYNNYLEVLRLYPGDSVAEAALINFQGNEDQARSESILKTFIQREPDNSFLHYSLGRHYAAQARWPEAQQSFFNAYSRATSNPDYAFNLAVSLDHVGQQQSAIDYYNVALELANQSSGSSASISFDRAVVISRIDALSNLADLR
jgi:Flp pilus assembly protein TadD